MNTAALHHTDCEWHHDQYDWECTCGAVRALGLGGIVPPKDIVLSLSKEETPMTQASKTAIRELKQSVERLSQAKSNPQQLDQVVQEIERAVQKLEQELDRD